MDAQKRTEIQMTIPVYWPGWADVTNSGKDIASKITVSLKYEPMLSARGTETVSIVYVQIFFVS
jgi:hypothetical protein